MSFWGDQNLLITVMKMGDVVRISPNPGHPIESCGDRFWSEVVDLFQMNWLTKNQIEKGYAIQFKIPERRWNKFIQNPLR